MRKVPIVVLSGLLVVLLGCGGGGEEEESIAPGTQPVATGPVVHDHGPGAGDQGCPAAKTEIAIVASATRFDTDCLTAAADQRLTLVYENKDQVSHGLWLLESHSSAEPFFRVDVFTGPRTQTFTIPPQKPGTYAFHCQVHPSTMTGTFVVK